MLADVLKKAATQERMNIAMKGITFGGVSMNSH